MCVLRGRAYPEHEIQTEIFGQLRKSQNKDRPDKPAAYMIEQTVLNLKITFEIGQ